MIKRLTLLLLSVSAAFALPGFSQEGVSAEDSPLRAVGGMYYETKDQRLTTFTSEATVALNGVKLKSPVLISGGNYFLTKSGLSTLNSRGVVVNKGFLVGDTIEHAGSNFLITSRGDTLTISSSGVIKRTKAVQGQKLVDAAFLSSGNYLETFGGVLKTVDKDGVIHVLPEKPDSRVLQPGGNFFVDQNGHLTTINDSGAIAIIKMKSDKPILWVGGSFFQTADGLFKVSRAGAIVQVPLKLEGPVIHNGSDFIETKDGLYLIDDSGAFKGPRVLVEKPLGKAFGADSAAKKDTAGK